MLFRFIRALAVLPALSLTTLPAPAADSDGQSKSASGIDLKAMDTSVNPCSNFYQYACGNWRKDNPIPPDRSRWSRFDELNERNLKIEREILEKASSNAPNRPALDQKIGDYYAACMDESAIDAQGAKPVEPALDAIRRMPSKSALTPELARLQRNGARALFRFYVGADEKHANMNIANLDQGGLGLPDRDYYLRPDPRSVELRKQYEQHVRNMFDLLAKAEGKSGADSAAQAATVMRIETALAKASLDRVGRRNPDNVYHMMALADLQSLSPEISWSAYFAVIGLPQIKTLNVAVPDFFKAVSAEIANTPLEDWKTYLIWHELAGNASLLSRPFREEAFQFDQRTLTGVKEMPARWKQCVTATDRALGEALGQKFVQVAFSGASKARALQLVGEIEKEMEKDIHDAQWMSPATKDQALTKLQEVTNKIGYPDKWRDYSALKIAPGDYFADASRSREFEVARNIGKFGKPVDKSEWGMSPPTVNAYYSPAMNNINFPAGILQPPFYNPKADDAVNYGGIGVVIGHELTHGFDDQGRRFDGAGNLRDWWTSSDAKNFEQRADCVVQEYGKFSPVEGATLNGKLTLGENAADNGGIHLAYMALMDSLAKHTMPKADGFTPQQQFFLGYAQIWCENTTEQAARLQANTNPHSPGQFRVNGVLQNLPEFSEAYSCKLGEPMVSTNPCRVW